MTYLQPGTGLILDQIRKIPGVNDYLKAMLRQVILGNYSDDVTLGGTAGQVGLGLLGLDLPMDVRDITYDLTHWNSTPGYQKLLAAIGLIPGIGALKYTDEAGALIKSGKRALEGISEDIPQLPSAEELARALAAIEEEAKAGKKLGQAALGNEIYTPELPTVEELVRAFHELGIADELGKAAEKNYGAVGKASIEGAGNIGTTRVGRWMSQAEYKKLLETGTVPESFSGTTHIAYPADISAFGRQAKPGSIYVEFDIPSASIKSTSNGWAKIIGPNSLEGRLALKKGLTLPEMPKATNIKIVGGK